MALISVEHAYEKYNFTDISLIYLIKEGYVRHNISNGQNLVEEDDIIDYCHHFVCDKSICKSCGNICHD